MIRYLLALLLALAVPLSPAPAPAQQGGAARRALVVGTHEAPPFVIRDPDGRLSGISIDLWRTVARDLGYTFTVRELPLDSLLRGVAAGTLDAGVGALTITAGRESTLDFTQPFYVTGLGIAVSARSDSGWLGVLRRLLSAGFLKVVLALGALLVLVGTLVWLFERRRNPEQFGGGPVRGVGAGVWWSAVTMTTVGYGDKAPQSVGGRLVGLVWMFAGVIIISSFTAAITSSLTLGSMRGPVQGPEDLAGARVGSVQGSTSGAYLGSHNIPFTPYDSVPGALTALSRGDLDAVVYDIPILRYEINSAFRGRLRVLPDVLEQQFYGFALPAGSPLREPINRTILARISTPDWEAGLARYLGP